MKIKFLSLTGILLSATLLPAVTPNPVEIEIANLVRNHAGQMRATMVHDPILHMVARAKAEDQASRAYFGHADPDGYGPNRSVQLAGYELPGLWGMENGTNFIESLTAGHPSASAAFQFWLNSNDHKEHLLGETAHYASQTRYGVGYAEVPGSRYTRYYVFISAPPNLDSAAILQPYAEWKFDHFTPLEIDTADDHSDHDKDGLPRLVEFVLDYDPKESDILPSPVMDQGAGLLEWTLPIRAQLGSVQVMVEGSSTLNSWSSSLVVQSGNTYRIETVTPTGFMRLNASNP